VSSELKDYCKIIEKHLDRDTCEKVIEEIESGLEWQQNEFYDNRTEKSFAPSEDDEECEMKCDTTISSHPFLMEKIKDAFYDYVIHHNFPSVNGWAGYSPPRFNKYSENQKMCVHADHINSLFDGERKGIPMFTGMTVLNDDFKGGEFVMFPDSKNEFRPTLETGDFMVFPSNFLYPHLVAPVKEKVRYSFSSWVW